MATADATLIKDAPDAQLSVSDCLYLKAGNVDLERGVIEDVAIVMEGEAKGHGIFIDKEFVQETVKQGNQAGASGLKSRFGHPAMSSTALGTFVGRYKNFREDTFGGKALTRADLFLSNSAKETPNGNLHNYVLSLAADDDKAFGNSIVFTRGKEFIRDSEGKKEYVGYETRDGYRIRVDQSGTMLRKGEKVFIEMKKLRASDLVDDPAATNGLFSEFNQATWAGQMSEFLDTHPEIFKLIRGNPEVIDGFFVKYEEYKKREGTNMADNDKKVEDELAEAKKENAALKEKLEADALAAKEKEAKAEKDAADKLAADKKADAALSDGEKFLKAFGDQGGVWYAQGMTFEEAQQKHLESVMTENEELKKRLAAVGETGGDAVDFEKAGENTGEGDFHEQAQAKAKAENTTYTVAAAALSKEKPGLLKAYRNREK